ncbi:hypothetical protein C5B90_12035 [Haloferax sp. Atlit-12N]|uniref:hypothetical protein n=1 Tax=Haloferax sp. Atlit-12N TaxID=2077203 RepID=UPI000E24BD71|nr:hypothetical protein [Haloferax sp. Atlit-12N]RDZ64317.1 hypothetical protein C5B90_12035 [Haloferax sp. Atlit-12N]
MSRTLELTGARLSYLLYAVQLAVLALVLAFVVPALEYPVNIFLGGLFAVVMLASVVALWRRAAGRDGGSQLGTADDITYDPVAEPGQAARDRWEKAVRRLPGFDDEK